MAQQTINIGSSPNDGTGDTIRDGGDKINDNFTELYTFDLGLSTSSSPQFLGLNLGHATDTTITRTGAGDIAVEGNAIYRAGGTDVPLADGGTGASLTDPGADRVLFWDDSANAVTWLTMGTNLTITGTTLDATGGGGSAIEVLDEGVSETATLVSLDFVGAGVAAVDDGSGNVTVTVSGASGAVTSSGYTMSTARLLGRTTASTGAIEEISAGAGITLSGGVISASGAGGSGGASWANVGSWTWSTNVTEVTFTGLAAYNELMVIIRGVTTSVTGVRRVQVSVDNGSSYFSGASDYIAVSESGFEANAATPGIAFHSTNATAARTLVAHILNTRGNVKVGEMNNATSAARILFVGSTSDINAIRIDNHTGGNLTAGSILLLGR